MPHDRRCRELLRGRAPRPRARRGPGRRRRSRRRSPASVARRRVRFERTLERLARARPARRRRRRRARSGGRRLARPADGRPAAHGEGLRDERRGRLRPLLARGRPAYVPREGLGPKGAIEAIRARRRPRRARPLLRGAGSADRSSASCVTRASAGSRSTTGRSTRRPSPRSGRSPGSSTRCRRVAATTMATPAPTPRPTPQLWVPPEVGERLAAALDASAPPRPMTDRPPDDTDSLPVLDLVPPRAGRRAAQPGRTRTTPGSPSSGPRTRRCRRFHVWTLGCQMNRSDSEEMAGRLLAAGCAEAPASRPPTSS